MTCSAAEAVMGVKDEQGRGGCEDFAAEDVKDVASAQQAMAATSMDWDNPSPAEMQNEKDMQPHHPMG